MSHLESPRNDFRKVQHSTVKYYAFSYANFPLDEKMKRVKFLARAKDFSPDEILKTSLRFVFINVKS